MECGGIAVQTETRYSPVGLSCDGRGRFDCAFLGGAFCSPLFVWSDGKGFHDLALQLFGGELQMKLAFQGDGDTAGLFADDDRQTVIFLRNTESRAVTKPQGLGDVGVVGDREDAAGGRHAKFGDDHRTVVKGRIFEEEIFDEPL